VCELHELCDQPSGIPDPVYRFFRHISAIFNRMEKTANSECGRNANLPHSVLCRLNFENRPHEATVFSRRKILDWVESVNSFSELLASDVLQTTVPCSLLLVTFGEKVTLLWVFGCTYWSYLGFDKGFFNLMPV